MRRKAARTFLENSDFDYDFTGFAVLGRREVDAFIRRVHYLGVTPLAERKWLAVHRIATWLDAFTNEDNFRKVVFNGKAKGAELDKSDIRRLMGLNLAYIGPANSQYLVKSLGGQAIKCDRWVRELLDWGNLPQEELERRLVRRQIPLSLFDTAIWAYCEMFIGRKVAFAKHFTDKFGYLQT